METFPISTDSIRGNPRHEDDPVAFRQVVGGSTDFRFSGHPRPSTVGGAMSHLTVAGRAHAAPGPHCSPGQLAVQDSVGTLLPPFHDPRNPKVVPAPAPRLPL